MGNKEYVVNIILTNPAEEAAGIILKNYIPNLPAGRQGLEHFDKQIKLIEDSVKVINQLTAKINEVK
ncbi:MAG: hypothetical protein KDC52_10620 [Ignavibacteriae bacterium]|nr:hypothetical protein [Ignavibacteriota bacterium]MCB0746261.1 hypothetical protein [Ignavibacteriota bacterium]MCB0751918.1 hypothetical protein [Ignavibacteriota bacterium]